jgi:2-oxoglutarate ferredoxin oxidoreductase subunit alpha
LEELNLERAEKYKKIKANEQRYDEIHCDDADLIVVAYGTAARVAGAAVRLARQKKLRVGLFRPITLWPFPCDALRGMSKNTSKFLVVEMNCGQMIDDVQFATECRAEVALHGRPGGGVPTPPEVFEKIEKVLGGGR